MAKAFNYILNYFSLVKFSHTVFALPFAILGYFLAVNLFEFAFKWSVLFLVFLCMIFARNSAMAFNRYIDRDIDKANPRTSMREIPQKIITPKASLFFVILNIILFVSATYFINSLCFYLSPLAIFIVLFYSYTKRFTSFSHLILGLSLAIAPSAAFIAASNTINISAIFLSAMVLFWTAGFDIIYSLQDEKFDKKNKLFSIPSKYGKNKALKISALFHIISVLFCLFFGIIISGNYLFWIAFFIFGILIFYQHFIIKAKETSNFSFAFQNINGLISVSFSVIVILSFQI